MQRKRHGRLVWDRLASSSPSTAKPCRKKEDISTHIMDLLVLSGKDGSDHPLPQPHSQGCHHQSLSLQHKGCHSLSPFSQNGKRLSNRSHNCNLVHIFKRLSNITNKSSQFCHRWGMCYYYSQFGVKRRSSAELADLPSDADGIFVKVKTKTPAGLTASTVEPWSPLGLRALL